MAAIKEKYHVVKSGKKWIIRKESASDPNGVFATKKEAIARACEIAKRQNVEMVIHTRSGSVSHASVSVERTRSANYIAILEKEDESDYGVWFPDFPGCISAGSTLEEAKDMAAEALALHIEGMREDGETIPAPSSLDAVMEDPDAARGVAFLVTAPAPPAKSKRINVTLPDTLIQAIDERVKETGGSRSGFLAQAAKNVLQ